VALERQAVELEAERHRAEAASLAKGSFVANMTHELRTPLTAILGYSEMLDRERSLDAEASQWIRTVRRSGEHLLALINDVLDYSKVEAGKMRVELIECDPRALFEDVRLLMAERASSRGVELGCRMGCSAPPARVRTDPTRLRQVLINLVGNAIKFTPSGTVRLLGSVIPGGPTGTG
jgi:signal transduction histidine kinase